MTGASAFKLIDRYSSLVNEQVDCPKLSLLWVRLGAGSIIKVSKQLLLCNSEVNHPCEMDALTPLDSDWLFPYPVAYTLGCLSQCDVPLAEVISELRKEQPWKGRPHAVLRIDNAISFFFSVASHDF